MTLLMALAARPQAVIFDMDGLMLDSERALLGCLAEAGAAAGHDLPEAFLLSLIGSSDALTRQRIAAQVGADAVDALLQDSYARYDGLVAAGVPLTAAGDATGWQRGRIAPLSLPWLPDDLYEAWLKAGADATDRSDPDNRIEGVSAPGVLPLVTMLDQGREAKVRLLLEHGGAPRTPARCGQAVADVLAWQLGNNGPVSPLGGRAVRQVLDAAGGAAGCDLNQASRVQAFEGVTAAELAQRANVSLPAAGSTR